MTEVRVAEYDRARYFEELRARKDHFRARGCNFWVFEDASRPGLFTEFAEAPDVDALTAAGVDRSSRIMTEVDFR